MNLNNGCIEISLQGYFSERRSSMNLNKGCIEIYVREDGYATDPEDEP